MWQLEAHDTPEVSFIKSLDKIIKGTKAMSRQKMLAEMHSDKNLAITFLLMGTGVIGYHFWEKEDGRQR